MRYLDLSIEVKEQLLHSAKIKKAHYSTKIEGNLLTYDQAEKAIKKKNESNKINAEREVINYWDALTFLEQAYEKKQNITIDFILELHSIIMRKGKKTKKSQFRGEMPPGVLFAVYDNYTKKPEYIPPEWVEIPELISELADWYQTEEDLPIPVKAAIFHYQFATIHPFEDGNGRCSRALVTYILMEQGYDFKGFNSMEEYYVSDIEGYYSGLQMDLPVNYYNGRNNPPQLENWIEFYIRIMALNAERTFETIEKASQVKPNEIIKALNKKDRKMLKFVIDNHFDEIKTKDLAGIFGVTPRAISKWCQSWCERGILTANYKDVRIISYSLSQNYKNLSQSDTGFNDEYLRDFD